MADLEVRKRSRDDSAEEAESGVDSPAVKKLRENLLESLDDDEAELCPTSQDLDSFMKSFEEEIGASPSAAAVPGADSRPDLGYLLEASDDELGLPPTATPSSSGGLGSELENELARVDSESSELGSEFWEIPEFDSFGYGFTVAETGYNGGNGEYVALDGLFDYSDMGFVSGGIGPSPETLPA